MKHLLEFFGGIQKKDANKEFNYTDFYNENYQTILAIADSILKKHSQDANPKKIKST